MQSGVATINNNNMVFVGMDVHKETYTLCAYSPALEEPSHIVKCKADYHNIIRYLATIRKQFGENSQFICGYEAGCLGFTLCRDLLAAGIDCRILAPTTMPKKPAIRLKTDTRDAKDIAKCLAYRTCSFVCVPNEEDEQTRDYIRMRNSHKKQLKINKQHISAFCLRHNLVTPHRRWTGLHISWLRSLELEPTYKEILTEYLITYDRLTETIARLDKRIAEIANNERYADKVNRLKCFIGICDYTALALVAEVGDFSRFPDANHFASFIGVTPGEHSSGEKKASLSITRAGNSLLRTLLTEASHCYSRGQIGFKSRALRMRQEGQSPEVIAYADRANDRLRRRYYHLMMAGKNGNKVRTAIVRELSCFIWGMMNNQIT